MGPFPLYKGATRVAVYWGVPLIPLVGMVMGVSTLAMLISLWWWGMLIPGWVFMSQVTRADDRAFRILGLWLRTRVLNRLRFVVSAGRGEFWGGSSYALCDRRRRAWDAEEGRWGG
jgi:type IV secretion system protein VirB3